MHSDACLCGTVTYVGGLAETTGIKGVVWWPAGRSIRDPANGVPRTHLPRTRVNISGRTLAVVPSHRVAYRLLERRGGLAERLFELGVIYHEGFLELVEHLDRLANDRVEQTYSPQQELRWRLDACWLANLLEDHLHELARRECLGAG